jgi:tRNA pseudouridine38-40 synthase
VRLRLTIAYDGTPYHGFAANAGVPTVEGTLGPTLERILGHPVELSVAGRTDRGVHAWGQVVSFDTTRTGDEVDLDGLRRSVNRMCGGTIVVREATVATPDFDARFSASWRRYRYTIVNRPVPDPFRRTTAWWLDSPLDLTVMRLACDPIIGEHDFSSFCRRPRAGPDRREPSLVRRVTDARWDDEGDGMLRFEIQATAFCHQMVRSIVGTHVDVGLGRRRAGEVAGVIRARDRHAAGQVAPPHGLCLWAVGYPDAP